MRVTALVSISLKVNAHGAQIHDTTGPNAGSTATPPEQVPDSILFQMLFYFLSGPLSSTIVQNGAQVCRKLCYSIQRDSRNWISEDRPSPRRPVTINKKCSTESVGAGLLDGPPMPTASERTAASRRRDVEDAVPYDYLKCSIESAGSDLPVGRISLTPGRSYGIMGYRTLCRPFWSKFQSRKGPTLCLIRRQCPS